MSAPTLVPGVASAAVREQVFRLPDLGEGLAEADILTWRVAEGDLVVIDQVVVEVETAKAVVEVPVPVAGVVLKLHAEAGSVLAVGQPLITVGWLDDRVATNADSDDAAARQYREEEQGGSGNVLIGYGTGHGPVSRRRRRSGNPGHARSSAPSTSVMPTPAPSSTPTPTPATAAPEPEPEPQPSNDYESTHASTGVMVISPLVRKLAREHGVDLAHVTPSGERGVILRRDVEQAVARVEKPQPATPTTVPTSTTATPDIIRIPITGLRRTVAEKLSRSRTEIPDATTWVDVDATGLLDAKAALQAADPERRISLLALLARFCVAGLRRFPELNSTVDVDRGEILRLPQINLGFAAQTDRGLMVPVLHDAHRMTTAQISAELARLTGLARSGGLPASALTGGTFTLNNYGVFGVDGSTPIINHPEAALLGVGRIIDKPWVVDGALAVRKVTQLSLTFDHRVCDGAAAGGFLRFVADCVEHPTVAMADM